MFDVKYVCLLWLMDVILLCLYILGTRYIITSCARIFTWSRILFLSYRISGNYFVKGSYEQYYGLRLIDSLNGCEFLRRNSFSSMIQFI